MNVHLLAHANLSKKIFNVYYFGRSVKMLKESLKTIDFLLKTFDVLLKTFDVLLETFDVSLKALDVHMKGYTRLQQKKAFKYCRI